MHKRANKALVMECRYVEKVKLADLWVTINVNSFNLVESLLLTEGERGRVKESIVPLGGLHSNR